MDDLAQKYKKLDQQHLGLTKVKLIIPNNKGWKFQDWEFYGIFWVIF